MMSDQDEFYRDTQVWPVERGRPVPALTVWFLMLKAMRSKMQMNGQEADDITDVTWVLREREMDRVQQKRAAYVTRYRPIQTLDGLDPWPASARRVATREASEAPRVIGRAFHG